MTAYSETDTIPAPPSPTIVGLILASGIALPSALLYAVPVGQRLIGFGLLLLTLGYFSLSRRRIGLNWIILMVFGLMLCSVTAFYWTSPTIVFVLGYAVLSICLVGMATLEEIKKAIGVSTVVLFIVVALAWVSAIYALGGGGPIWHLGNPGQPLSLYLTSLALTVQGQRVGNLIRPAGIFDEPGALAFFVSLCAGCRMLLDMPKRTTWLLLVGGMVTSSLALLVFILVVGTGEAFTRSKSSASTGGIGARIRKQGWVLASAGSILLIVFIVRYYNELSLVAGFVFGRLEFGGGGSGRLFAGDSRTEQTLQTIRLLNLRVFLFGVSESCFRDLQVCGKLELGGGNPLAPLLLRGALSQFLYYYILAVMLVQALLSPRRAAVYIGIVLMFFQRPYVLSLGYSTWAAMAVMMSAKRKRAPAPLGEG